MNEYSYFPLFLIQNTALYREHEREKRKEERRQRKEERTNLDVNRVKDKRNV